MYNSQSHIWSPNSQRQGVSHVRDVWCHRTSSYEKAGQHVAVWLIWFGSRINRVSTLISGSSLHTAAGDWGSSLHNVSIMATLLTKAISVTHSPNAHLSCCESNESSSNGAWPSQVGSFMKCLCLLMARGFSHGQPVLKTPLCRWAAICSPLLVSCF